MSKLFKTMRNRCVQCGGLVGRVDHARKCIVCQHA